MNGIELLEDFLYGWVRQHAPHVSREAVDALIDNSSDLYREAAFRNATATKSPEQFSDRDEILRGWADLT